ncbi:MAG TPA: hypothetical protein VFA61_13630 [Candidatus Udaeobacter sp.]|nr:hypothetical protein [Candidatus Udaeobacter sp.]
MTKRFLTLFLAIGFASICALQAQSPTPGESPAGAPKPAKHRTSKKAQTTASPGEAAASASPAKRGRKKAETGTAASTATSPSPAASPAAGPKAKRTRKKAAAATSPSASPAKFSLGDLFKPKSSAAASPAAATAPVRSTESASNPPAPGGGHGLVWVNTESHVYHREGSRFYGTTKKGKYMTEADAIKEGDRAAGKAQ